MRCGSASATARYDGVASFGRRPTFDNGAPLLEVFLFDFSGDLYGRTLDVALIGWIRPEEKFTSVEALVAQMNVDSARARDALKRSGDAFPRLGRIYEAISASFRAATRLLHTAPRAHPCPT